MIIFYRWLIGKCFILIQENKSQNRNRQHHNSISSTNSSSTLNINKFFKLNFNLKLVAIRLNLWKKQHVRVRFP